MSVADESAAMASRSACFSRSSVAPSAIFNGESAPHGNPISCFLYTRNPTVRLKIPAKNLGAMDDAAVSSALAAVRDVGKRASVERLEALEQVATHAAELAVASKLAESKVNQLSQLKNGGGC